MSVGAAMTPKINGLLIKFPGSRRFLRRLPDSAIASDRTSHRVADGGLAGFAIFQGKRRTNYATNERNQTELTYMRLVLDDVREHRAISVEEGLVPPQGCIPPENFIDSEFARCFWRLCKKTRATVHICIDFVENSALLELREPLSNRFDRCSSSLNSLVHEPVAGTPKSKTYLAQLR